MDLRAAFTLMEVNLAIFIMATGLLAMVALYPLAYRENRQSQDDVKGAAAADCVLNALEGALSSRDITWNDWENAIESAWGQTGRDNERNGGWLAYCRGGTDYTPANKGAINSKAQSVYGALMGAYRGQGLKSWPLDSALVCAIVAQWGRMPVLRGTSVSMEPDHSRVAISLRVARRAGDLFAQPIYYTEIHFQGDQEKLQE